MKESDQIHLRSTEVQEILSRPPHALIRYGTVAISLVVLILLAAAFLFTYPDKIQGKVTIVSNVTNAELTLTDNSQTCSGIVEVSLIESRNIAVGQPVFIQLTEFPYLEFGMLKGIVQSKPLKPEGDFYLIEIAVSVDIRTAIGKAVVEQGELRGTAEVITNKRSLFSRIFSTSQLSR